ncbi:hypothetical protein R1flu_001642 [Riccia fluitans]|uniref:Uncharacterized protein n=1 Tax=Riccia fluitans TaxID=41844 RepID=A0ABD1Y758_9MARC
MQIRGDRDQHNPLQGSYLQGLMQNTVHEIDRNRTDDAAEGSVDLHLAEAEIITQLNALLAVERADRTIYANHGRSNNNREMEQEYHVRDNTLSSALREEMRGIHGIPVTSCSHEMTWTAWWASQKPP